jgi:formate hydrogenlyase transcriptional activator
MLDTGPTATIRDSLARYEALLRVSHVLARHKTIAELVHVLAAQLHSVVPFDVLALVLHEASTDEMRLVVLEPKDSPQPPVVSMPVAAEGPAASVWMTQKAAIIPVPADGFLPPALDFARRLGQTITCWLPLTTTYRRVGVLAFGSSRSNEYSEDAIEFMEHVAAQVAIAVDNSINFDESRRYEQELQGERDRLRLLLEISNALVSDLDYGAVLKAISESFDRVIKHEYVSVAIYDRQAAELRVQLAYDDVRGSIRPEVVVPMDRSPIGVTFECAVASVFRRQDWEAFGPDGAPPFGSESLESLCCVPLVTARGKVGTLNVASSAPDAFPAEEVELLKQVSGQIAIAVENALAYRGVIAVKDHLAEEKLYLESEVRAEFGDIIGRSRGLRSVLKAAQTVASTDATVLLLGETGTGKELVARAIHNLSPRKDRTFVRFSGAALPATLLESELFGYEKGAFTGATMRKVGRLELSDHGTLFLDEVGDIPSEVQPKLLRVLQEREFERLGSTRTQHVDVRIVAATNRDLERMVEEGTFRSDLYYRLSVFPIQIPPLRERPEDIPALARYFTNRFAQRMHRPITTIRPGVMDALQRWHWPGNIRELQNVIQRAVILSPGPELQLSLQDLRPKPAVPVRGSMASTLHDVNRQAILDALRDSSGIVAGPRGAAARLGLKRTTLQSMMRKLGIRRPSY